MISNEGIRGVSVSYALFFYLPLLGDILCMMLTEWQKMRCEIRESVHRKYLGTFKRFSENGKLALCYFKARLGENMCGGLCGRVR